MFVPSMEGSKSGICVLQAYAETRSHALATLVVTLESLYQAGQADAKFAAKLLRDVNINNLLVNVVDLKVSRQVLANAWRHCCFLPYPNG
jgi:hypothetical protein